MWIGRISPKWNRIHLKAFQNLIFMDAALFNMPHPATAPAEHKEKPTSFWQRLEACTRSPQETFLLLTPPDLSAVKMNASPKDTLQLTETKKPQAARHRIFLSFCHWDFCCLFSNSQSFQCTYDQYRKPCSKIISGISELFFQNSWSITMSMLRFLRELLDNSKGILYQSLCLAIPA